MIFSSGICSRNFSRYSRYVQREISPCLHRYSTFFACFKSVMITPPPLADTRQFHLSRRGVSNHDLPPVCTVPDVLGFRSFCGYSRREALAQKWGQKGFCCQKQPYSVESFETLRRNFHNSAFPLFVGSGVPTYIF